MTLKKLYEQIESVKRMKDACKPHSHRRKQLEVRLQDLRTQSLILETKKTKRAA
jgi:hypothetical protein